MKEKRCILQIDKDPKAVIEPDYEQQPFKFHSKLLFAFVPKEDIDNFLEQVPHKVLGSYDTISFQPDIRVTAKLDSQFLVDDPAD